MNQEAEWITPEQAAEIMGVKVRMVQHLCLENKEKENPDFVCKKWGHAWMVSAESARNYVRTNRGRPSKN